jgi:cytidine deaminase
MDDSGLIAKAQAVARPRAFSEECSGGSVGAALLTAGGNVYVGVSIDAACGIGFCAEHGAIAQMITRGESQIVRAVAVTHEGKIIPPCGRCRELMHQVNRKNLKAEILLEDGRTVRLEELLPERWQEAWT